MPVIRVAESLPPQFQNQLVERLAIELGAEPGNHANQEPVVYESPIPPTDRFFAVVVWSAWEDIPWGQRTTLILEGYRSADKLHPARAARAPLLATANGLTWDEASDTGFFKYAIIPPAIGEGALADAIRTAMLAAGGTETPDGVKLRFLDRRSAQKAAEQLRQTLPAVQWAETKVYRTDE